jgi:hypothetical protein
LTLVGGQSGTATWERYRRIGQRRIRGWVDPESLDVLRVVRDAQDAIGVTGSVAEIGVHHGRLFIGLQVLVPAGTPAVAIDLFENQAENTDGSGKGDRARFEANVRRWGDWASARVHAINSQEVTPSDLTGWAEGPIRLFSVDGGHAAEVVTSDLGLAEETLADGGVIAVDDVFNPEWPGVVDGTLAHLRSGSSLVPFAVAFDKVWFTNSPDAAARYRSALQAEFGSSFRAARKESIFAGHAVEVVQVVRVTPRTVLRRFGWARRLRSVLAGR